MKKKKMNSSSLHAMNADKFKKDIGFHKKVSWMILNYLNNCFPYNSIDPNLKFIKFIPSDADVERYWEILPRSTPVRILCDLFWIKFPWVDIIKTSGKIHIMDIGCGSAAYFRLFDLYSGVDINYFGADIYEDVSLNTYKSDPRFKFQSLESINSKFIRNLLDEGVNLITSLFTLEHVDDDLRYIRCIKNAINEQRKNVLQIHIFPSAECLYYYFLHGVRQYNPRTVSKFSRLFENRSNCFLIGMGGRQAHKYFLKENISWRISNRLKEVTDMKKFLHSTMSKTLNLKNAMKRDHLFSSPRNLLYALIIDSRKPGDRFTKEKLTNSLNG
jgi:SAM-dependent methyltransferase